ncbi:adenylate kinase 7-like [Acanthochromis polyacanthus]|uniref:adenylate kinase 7-like n=1 Tax=Acanthochromis polyacanthus TaxID=80966 RepID=UPI0022342150|nr:adenylate kinase 7-like [Acanthochromis polyacanthus]
MREHLYRLILFIRSPTRDRLLQCLLECDVVVYNISESSTQQQVEEATWALTALHNEMENFKSRKIFILVSTVMTWAMTKPRNQDETDVLVTEEEFKRRRPHPRFRNHNNLEKLVLTLTKGKKSKLSGYVVASGLQYGKGEDLFHYFFKISWLMQFPKVSLFGEGTNHVPMIHVYDLGGVIQNIIELKPKFKYILAVDDSKYTLEDIVKPEELECLSIDLSLEAFIIKDSFNLNWISEAGMVENMENIVEDYKDTRQLLPVRIFLIGPPAVGKTSVAQKLCHHYKIHHIKIKDIIEEKITQLCFVSLGRLADHVVFDILQEKLSSKPCRNQGFVLDGFPKTYEQAKHIFSEHVLALNASDYFLTKRVQGLPESVVEKMRYTKDEFLPRLTRYRQLSGAEETLLDYFDQFEIHPQHIVGPSLSGNPTPAWNPPLLPGTPTPALWFPHPGHYSSPTINHSSSPLVLEAWLSAWVQPAQIRDTKNYGLSPEEQNDEDQKKEQERKQKLAAEAAERKRRKEAVLAEMAAQYEEWQKNLSEVKRQEYKILETRCLPLRNYLMKYVMPYLTEAMLECCKIKPEDSVDFLAEHLLQSSQQK